MKKYIVGAMLAVLTILPLSSYAQEVSLTPESKAELIAELNAKLVVLLQELINQLIVEMQNQTTIITNHIDNAPMGSINGTTVVQLPITMQTITLNKVCRANKEVYQINSDSDVFSGSIKGTILLQDGTTSELNWAFDNYGKKVEKFPELDFDLGSKADFTIKVFDSAKTEVGSLADSVTINSCE